MNFLYLYLIDYKKLENINFYLILIFSKFINEKYLIIFSINEDYFIYIKIIN
jgi:hypothetical protein